MLNSFLPALPGAPLAMLAIGSIAMLIVIVFALIQVRTAEVEQRNYLAAWQRLPAAAQLEGVEARLDLAREELAKLEEKIREARQGLTDADQARLDAQHWQERAEQARNEFDALDDKRKAVDAVRDEFEKHAANLAERRAELAQVTADVTEAHRQLAIASERLLVMNDSKIEADELEKRVAEASETLQKLRAEIVDLGLARDELNRARFDAQQFEARKATLEQAILDHERRLPQLQDQQTHLEREIARLSLQADGLAKLQVRSAELDARIIELGPKVAQLEGELRRMQEERAALGNETSNLREAVAADGAELARLLQGLAGARMEVEKLESRRSELESRVALLEQQATALSGRSDSGSPGDKVDPTRALGDLLTPPSCLFDSQKRPLLPQAATDKDEGAALGRVSDYLKGHGLSFTDRVLKRFHTSLKIGQISPLTVLAGISGTGKSLLPQRYAEAMGIHFLKLAVQPRWDSPQDLLGFYNYLEKRYKATDLARSLLCMDGTITTKSAEGSAGSMSDRVLLVLLDEMNIARVEYYFSEFLSRLEGRPDHEDKDDAKRRSSRIEIEVPGASVSTSIYPGLNVLFAGTMNQDESTQSLSDKVLDRGNTLLFRKPSSFTSAASGSAAPAERHLPFETWRSWQRRFDQLPASRQTDCKDLVDQLSDGCAAMRRPFGFRIAQSIFAYVANHPDVDSDAGMRSALADMVELRLLPKLRGVELEGEAASALGRIGEIVEKELKDPELKQRIKTGSNRGDVFDWAAA